MGTIKAIAEKLQERIIKVEKHQLRARHTTSNHVTDGIRRGKEEKKKKRNGNVISHDEVEMDSNTQRQVRNARLLPMVLDDHQFRDDRLRRSILHNTDKKKNFSKQ
ncbi:uncharacterized protein LOC116415304 [Apis florea]|uniref:uncharacterized protein LOC116415304 n=1 Tax=Apis florea TaxID=7463 RepID=UPI0012FF0DE7|nr:uncharacterized protein LOC116415304 [Apis florea]